MQDYQIIDPYPVSDYSKELDLYLRLTFKPPTDGILLDIFEETPPVLEKTLALRIAHAAEILTKILETHDYPEIQSESESAKVRRLSFQGLLLPSPPEPGSYTWEKTA
ncbi:MAG: hypothetical protein LBB43_03020 [Spirochaetaceae bacterium]|nr:hypothetical protein [Spirochaetaceae bacterium]